MKKISFFLIVAVLLWAFAEVVALGAYRIIFRTPYDGAELAARRAQLLVGGQGASREELRQQEYLIHPYFGYVSDTTKSKAKDGVSAVSAARAYGFDCEGQVRADFPREVFTVAVTGGSVAKYFVANAAERLTGRLAKLPQTAGRRIQVIGLGNYSYKQPQQLHIISDLIALGAHFDLVINIDGFNEVAHPMTHNLPNGVFPFFPSGWSGRVGDTAHTNLGDAGLQQLMRNLRLWLAKAFSKPWLNTPVGNTLWACADRLATGRINELEKKRLAAPASPKDSTGRLAGRSASGKVSYGPALDLSEQELFTWMVRHWAISSAMIADMVASQGGHYLHVLQPNQYDKGSKPLSEQELKEAFTPTSPYRAGVEKGYPLLRLAGKALANSGVDFTDTSALFSNQTGAIYRDDCCHYNLTGERILADALADLIAKALARPARNVSLVQLETRLAETLPDPGRVVRLGTYTHDFLTQPPTWTVNEGGLWDTEHNPGKPQERWRWGLWPKTRIEFLAPAGAVARLDATLISTLAGQQVEVLANGKVVDKWTEIGPRPEPQGAVRKFVEFPVVEGRNSLDLAYKSADDEKLGAGSGTPRKLAVVFYTLKLTVRPGVDSSVAFTE